MSLRKIFVLSFLVSSVLTLGGLSYAAPPPSDAGVVLDAGVAVVAAPSVSAPPPAAPPSASLPDPAEHPLDAWNEEQLARKTSWPLAVFAVLLMVTKALAYGRAKLQDAPVIGAAARWLALDKHAMWVTGLGTVAAAAYDVLRGGGSLVAGLIAAAVAYAGLVHSRTVPAPEGK